MDIYRKIVLTQAPRIMGFGDRRASSDTFGCFDRYYWHYKLHDMPNARFQETALLLALLFKYDFTGNIFYNKQNVKEWAKAAINFWSRLRNRDGSLNEVYPYERSFCATSFSAYAITEAMLEADLGAGIELEKTGEWLMNNNNTDVSNQTAAAALALYNIHTITGDKRYEAAAKKKLELLAKSQYEDGFLKEYDGYDIGYQTLTISLLARYCKKNEDECARSVLTKALKAVGGRIRGDGSYDNTETSRSTEFLYPYGFTALRSDVIKKHTKGLEENSVLNPGWMDDRYCAQLAVDYLQAYLEGGRC